MKSLMKSGSLQLFQPLWSWGRQATGIQSYIFRLGRSDAGYCMLSYPAASEVLRSG